MSVERSDLEDFTVGEKATSPGRTVRARALIERAFFEGTITVN